MPFLHNISFILFLIEINVLVSIKMDIDTISFGRVIVLTCRVHGIRTIDITTTRQWSMGDDDKLLCYNGRINNLGKYKEKVLPGNEFSLTVFNVTESDLNVVYQCRYGFDAASKLIEADEPKTFLSLRLVKDSIMLGRYIILTCTVNGLSTVDRDVTRQWSMGKNDELLSYNGRINNRRKYEETIPHGNEFSLKIFNVTEKDVNVTYRCRYGFDTATYFIEMNESVSLQKRVSSYHSFNISSSYNASVQKDEEKKNNGTIASKENFGTKTTMILLSTLIPLAAILVLAVVLFIAKRKNQRKGTKKKNKKTDKNITEDETFLSSTEDESL
ncbi:uncharacterized protein LOC143058790 [Mytilus galloprovincialis]|uniref:uncharacterized protein LOC143058790 n=1 Tax=Mytilus galloprovincialis TaxID=29158 RepID=UPI003F7BA994